MREHYGMSILSNLEKFPIKIDELDKEYYDLVASAINSIDLSPHAVSMSRFYVQKRRHFLLELKDIMKLSCN